MLPKIVLNYLTHPALIIEQDAGVLYRNQVGGYACYQAETRGVLCPLRFREDDRQRLEELPYIGGHEGLSESLAVSIDAILASNPLTEFIKVDRTRLDECWEAWVCVVLDAPRDTPLKHSLSPLSGFHGEKGVLIWLNSD